MSKSFIPYASHATWNLDRPEAAAISKSIIPKLVTLPGILMDRRPLQAKASFPMLVTLLGILMDRRFLQPQKA